MFQGRIEENKAMKLEATREAWLARVQDHYKITCAWIDFGGILICHVVAFI